MSVDSNSRKKTSSFIVEEKESFPFGFVLKTIAYTILVFALFFSYIFVNIYKANSDFYDVFTGSSKLEFNNDRFVSIVELVNKKDLEDFLTIYVNTNAKTFNEKMDIVLKKYNSSRQVYLSDKENNANIQKEIKDLSWVLSESMWNYKYPNFSDKASLFYSERGMENNFIDYMRSRFFIEKSKVFVENDYNPNVALDKSTKNIQGIIEKALNKKDYQDLIYLVGQINVYLGYTDYISENFLKLASEGGTLSLLQSGLFDSNLKNIPFYDVMMLNDIPSKDITVKGLTMATTSKDKYIEDMWSILINN